MTLQRGLASASVVVASTFALAISIVLLCPWLLFAEQGLSQEGVAPQFEVVSIKPTTLGRQPNRITPSSLIMPSVSLEELISFAYQIQVDRIVDGEDWTRSERFELRAVTPAMTEVPRPQWAQRTQVMVRRLLLERFSLQLRDEDRMRPVYVLRLKDPARTDVPGMRPVDPECEKARRAVLAGGSQPPAAPVSPAGELPPPRYCGLTAGLTKDTVTLVGGYVSMFEFQLELETYLDRPVVDETGIQHHFGIHVAIDRNQIPRYALSTGGNQAAGGPSIWSALADDLNMSLSSETRPLPVKVIEHAARPTPN